MPPPPPPVSPPDAQAEVNGRSPRPGVLEAFGLLLWAFLAQILVLAPAMALGLVDLEGDGIGLVLFSIVGQAVVLAGALLWLGARGRLGGGHVGQFRVTGRALLAGVGLGVGGYLMVLVLVNVGTRLIGPVDPPQQRLLAEVLEGGIVTLLVLFAAVVMAPLWEELLFRGVLFRSLDERIGVLPAALISGVVFAVIHIEVRHPLYLTGLTLLGVLFALGLRRTGNLLVPILAHATFNGIVLSTALIVRPEFA